MRTERPVTAEPARVTVRLSAELIYHLASRARRTASGQPPQAQIVTEVALLRSLLDLELRRVPLTVAEAGCLADVLNGALVADALGPLAFNRVEAEAVIAWVLEHPVEPGTLGVVTPFTAQADLIRDRLHAALGSSADGITVGTAHKFQGEERDVVLFSTVLAADALDGTVG
jgi:hypothetical protein